jgi:hypothetical protein
MSCYFSQRRIGPIAALRSSRQSAGCVSIDDKPPAAGPQCAIAGEPLQQPKHIRKQPHRVPQPDVIGFRQPQRDDRGEPISAKPAATPSRTTHPSDTRPFSWQVQPMSTVTISDDPPDCRPVYVGKAESSLSSRDVGTHFGFAREGSTSITGSSTPRRTVGTATRRARPLRGRYRNHLLATYWEMPTPAVKFSDVEREVLNRQTSAEHPEGVASMDEAGEAGTEVDGGRLRPHS